MPAPRKIFRIEETAAARPANGIEDARAAPQHADLSQEVNALRALLAAANAGPSSPAPAEPRLAPELNRIARELDAVVKGTEQATQQILWATEEIDQAANNLSAALKGKVEQGLAQDIQDLAVQIFEACNFQDLAGQRVSKVMATLALIEDHIARVLDEARQAPRRDGKQHLHGPRLAGDRGHATQNEIDAIFAPGAARA